MKRAAPVAIQFAILAAAGFLAPMLVHSSTLGIPVMSAELGMTAKQINWFPLAIVTASAIFQFPSGKLGDLYGKRNIFVIGVVIAALASALGGASNTVTLVIAARFLQGIGNAFIFATSLSLLAGVSDDARRGTLVGTYLAITYAGITSGPFVGGLIIDSLGWRYVFWIPVPLLLSVAVAAHFVLSPRANIRQPGRLDWKGCLLFAAAMLMIAPSLLSITDLEFQLLLTAGLLTLAGFCVYQASSSSPLIDVRLFRLRPVYGWISLSNLLLHSCYMALPFVLTLYFQYIKGLSPKSAGTVLMVQAIMTAIASPFSARLQKRFSTSGIALAGYLSLLCGIALFASFDDSTPLIVGIVALIALGLGLGVMETPVFNYLLGKLPVEERSAASAASATMRVLGSMIGIGLVSVFVHMFVGEVEITPAVYTQLNQALGGFFFTGLTLILLSGFCVLMATRPKTNT